MKILIVSDTHRKDDNLKKVIERNLPLDMFIHLGDAEGSENRICEWVNPECRMEMVLGNNDFFSMLDREREIQIGKYKALITHGHYYGVSVGTERIKEEARSRGCDIVMFGHTHRCYLWQGDGLTVLNPGSLSFPRQEGRKPTYMLMEIDDSEEAHYTLKYFEKKD